MFTLVDHELYIGDRIRLETTGALPTGLSVDTDYFVVYNGMTTSTFQVANFPGGDPIETTAAGSGTHSFIQLSPFGLRPNLQDNR